MSDAKFCICGCGQKLVGDRRLYAQGRNPKRGPKPTDADFPNPNPSGLCMCGCGEVTTIARRTETRLQILELWHRSQPNGVRREDYHCPGCTCSK